MLSAFAESIFIPRGKWKPVNEVPISGVYIDKRRPMCYDFGVEWSDQIPTMPQLLQMRQYDLAWHPKRKVRGRYHKKDCESTKK